MPRSSFVNFNFDYFFDRNKVLEAEDKAAVRNLSRFGAFTMTTARRSIRTRKKISEPGSPPTNRTSLLKRNIFFSYDPNSRSVVIGPVKLNMKSGHAAELLEHGGTVPGHGRVIIVDAGRGRDRRGRITSGKKKIRVKGNMHYRARPYMGPAFEKELPTLPPMWQDSIR